MTPVATGTLSPQPGSQEMQSWLLQVNPAITQHRKKLLSEGFFIGSPCGHWLSAAGLHRPHVVPISSSVFCSPQNHAMLFNLPTNLHCELQLILLVTTLSVWCSIAQCGLLDLNPAPPVTQLHEFWKAALYLSFPICRIVIILASTSHGGCEYWDS